MGWRIFGWVNLAALLFLIVTNGDGWRVAISALAAVIAFATADIIAEIRKNGGK